MAGSVADIHIPGTNICDWPSWLREPLVQIYPGITAACAAGAVIHNDAKDLQKYAVGLPGSGATSGSLTSDIGAINNVLGALTQKNTWLRVGEFAVGAILLYVGLRSMFPSQVQAVTGPVKTAAKVVTK
jgi:hypothetical protein